MATTDPCLKECGGTKSAQWVFSEYRKKAGEMPIPKMLLAALVAVFATGGAYATIPANPAQPPVPGRTRAPVIESEKISVHVIARNLDHPWGLQFLPGGRILLTERSGRMVIVEKNGSLTPVAGVPRVRV